MDQEREHYADEPPRPVSRWVYIAVCAVVVGAMLVVCNLTGGFRIGPTPYTVRGPVPPG
jgi:hypothetical protein